MHGLDRGIRQKREVASKEQSSLEQSSLEQSSLEQSSLDCLERSVRVGLEPCAVTLQVELVVCLR